MKLNPVCFAAFFCFGAVFSAFPQQVKVMQWNIHGNLGTSTAQSGTGAAAIGRILNYLQPDVLLINEVADGTVQVNTSALTQWVTDNLPYMAGGTFYVAVSTESCDIQRNAAISRYPILAPFTYADVSSSLRGMHSFQLQLAGTNRLQVFHVNGGLSDPFTNLFVVTNTTAGTNTYLDIGTLTNASARYYRVRLLP